MIYKDVCRLCLSYTSEYDLENISLQPIINLKSFIPRYLNVTHLKNHLACHTCIKSIDTVNDLNDKISKSNAFIYFASAKLKVDSLKFEHLKQFKNIPRNHLLCRICLEIIPQRHVAIYYFDSPVNVLPFQMVQHIMKETKLKKVTLTRSENDIICKECWKDILTVCSFKKNWNQVEKKIKSYCEAKRINPFFINSEDLQKIITLYDVYDEEAEIETNSAHHEFQISNNIHIKSEIDDPDELETIERPEMIIKSELYEEENVNQAYQDKSYESDNEAPPELDLEGPCSYNPLWMPRNMSESEDLPPLLEIQGHCTDIQIQNVYSLQPESKLLIKISKSDQEMALKALSKNSRKGSSKVKNPANWRRAFLKCELCDFKTHYSASFIRHKIFHETNRIQLYNCSYCDFKSSNSGNFKKHVKICQTNSQTRVLRSGKKSKKSLRKNKKLNPVLTNTSNVICKDYKIVTRSKGLIKDVNSVAASTLKVNPISQVEIPPSTSERDADKNTVNKNHVGVPSAAKILGMNNKPDDNLSFKTNLTWNRNKEIVDKLLNRLQIKDSIIMDHNYTLKERESKGKPFANLRKKIKAVQKSVKLEKNDLHGIVKNRKTTNFKEHEQFTRVLSKKVETQINTTKAEILKKSTNLQENDSNDVHISSKVDERTNLSNFRRPAKGQTSLKVGISKKSAKPQKRNLNKTNIISKDPVKIEKATEFEEHGRLIERSSQVEPQTNTSLTQNGTMSSNGECNIAIHNNSPLSAMRSNEKISLRSFRRSAKAQTSLNVELEKSAKLQNSNINKTNGISGSPIKIEKATDFEDHGKLIEGPMQRETTKCAYSTTTSSNGKCNTVMHNNYSSSAMKPDERKQLSNFRKPAKAQTSLKVEITQKSAKSHNWDFNNTNIISENPVKIENTTDFEEHGRLIEGPMQVETPTYTSSTTFPYSITPFKAKCSTAPHSNFSSSAMKHDEKTNLRNFMRAQPYLSGVAQINPVRTCNISEICETSVPSNSFGSDCSRKNKLLSTSPKQHNSHNLFQPQSDVAHCDILNNIEKMSFEIKKETLETLDV